MSVVSSRKVSLNQLIERYLAADTTRKKSGAKGAITRWANDRAAEIGVVAARSEVLEVLGQFEDLPEWILQRFTPGSLYQEGDRLMGWWDEESQVQAEELPFYWSGDFYEVSFYGRSGEIGLWNLRGFYDAERLPVTYYSRYFEDSDSIRVDFPIERSLFFLEYGYALPCQLQWNWGIEGLVVRRSIIDQGWWCAWKWWGEGTRWWYLANRPELFADLDWWGETEEGDKPRPYDVVLGGLSVIDE